MTKSDAAKPPDGAAAIIQDLAPRGVVRAAINTGNPILAHKGGGSGSLQGVSVEIAIELGRSLGRPVELVAYDTAGQVFGALDRNEWDVAFLAIEAARADRVIFSAPYVSIEGTYLVRHGAPYNAASELDHEGSRIAVAAHAAYDLFLTRTLRRAELVRAPTPAAALDLIADEGVSGAAGVRQALESFARGRADLRVLPDVFMTIEQALATPLHREAGGAYLQPFIADLTSSGWLRAALDRNGQSGVRIATPQLDMANATPIL
jgi:polar amino acid transport system substrate-binding protein